MLSPSCDPANDAYWWDGFALPIQNGSIMAAISYGPDLVVGGTFTQAGHARALRVAGWNGASWSAFGEGLPKTVDALVEWNGHIVAGCLGTPDLGADQPLVYEFDGGSWIPLGAIGYPEANSPSIRALAVYNGDLIAGGSFTHADGQLVSGVARWNGTSWEPLGSGLSATNTTVLTLLNYGGDLVAGGSFDSYHNIARWNGVSWSVLGAGFDSPSQIQALATDGQSLYASGSITGSGGVDLMDLARWNGSTWSSFGNGGFGALTFCDGSVIARIGSSVSRWTGTSWSPVGTGLSSGLPLILAPWGIRLVAAGSVSVAGQLSNGLYAYDGANWVSIAEPWSPGMAGTNGGALAAVPWEGSLLVAASSVGAQDHFITVPSVGVWDGAQWAPFGPANGLRMGVRSFSVWRGALIAAGIFQSPIAPRNVGRWNGSVWQTMGGGLNGQPWIWDTAVYDDELIAVGAFSRDSAGTVLQKIAAWDGIAWHPLGSGFDSFEDEPYTAIPYGSDLVVTGEFADAGGVPAANIARWDGSGWHALGNGIDGFGYAVEVFEGDLVVGGEFTSAGGSPAAGVARWDGTTWSAMGDGVIEMQAFRVIDGRLYGAGEFSCDGEEVLSLAIWTGERWNLLGSGFTPGAYISFIEPWNGDVYVGGTFGWANGKASFGIARWTGASLIEVPAAGMPSELAPRLWPNPTAGSSRIELALPAEGRVVIEVLDLAGRRVATVQDGVRPAGRHTFVWEALDERSRRCPAGLYLVRVTTPFGSRTLRCIRVR